MWLLCGARVYWIVARELGVVVSVLLYGCFEWFQCGTKELWVVIRMFLCDCYNVARVI